MFIPVFVIFLLSLTVFQWLKRVKSVCDNKLLRSVVGYNQNLLPQGGEFPADEHFSLRDPGHESLCSKTGAGWDGCKTARGDAAYLPSGNTSS